MNYKAKRNLAGLSLYTMAKQLGIPEERYKEVEQRKRPLEGPLVDKFQSVIKHAKQINWERRIRLTDIDRWFKSGEVENAINEYGYSRVELAKELGLSATTTQDAIKHAMGTNDVKEKIYDFLTNPINKKIIGESKKQEPKKQKKKEGKRIENLKERIKKLGMTQVAFSKEADCSQYTLSHLITGIVGVSDDLVEKIEQALIRLENEKGISVVETPVEIVEEVIEEVVEEPTETVEETVEVVEEVEEAPVVETEEKDYKALYEELTLKYTLLLDETTRAKRQIMLYEKLIEKM